MLPEHWKSFAGSSGISKNIYSAKYNDHRGRRGGGTLPPPIWCISLCWRLMVYAEILIVKWHHTMPRPLLRIKGREGQMRSGEGGDWIICVIVLKLHWNNMFLNKMFHKRKLKNLKCYFKIRSTCCIERRKNCWYL